MIVNIAAIVAAGTPADAMYPTVPPKPVILPTPAVRNMAASRMRPMTAKMPRPSLFILIISLEYQSRRHRLAPSSYSTYKLRRNGQRRIHQMLGQEPDLQLIHAQHAAHQQIVAAEVIEIIGLPGHAARLEDHPFIRLERSR